MSYLIFAALASALGDAPSKEIRLSAGRLSPDHRHRGRQAARLRSVEAGHDNGCAAGTSSGSIEPRARSDDAVGQQ